MEQLKTAYVASTICIFAYLSPICGSIIVLVCLFFADLIFGILASMLVRKQKLKGKKAIREFASLAVYIVIISGVFFVMNTMGHKHIALPIVSVITYAFLYFYSTNIIRSLRELFPRSMQLKFIEFVWCLEFIKRVPFMEDFVKFKEENKKREPHITYHDPPQNENNQNNH